MNGILRRLLGRPTPGARPRPEIVRLPDDGRIVYAIGDIHGCERQLIELEAAIIDAERGTGRSTLLIHLGDMIDRGPASASVLDRLMKPLPDGFERLCLFGNHELAMLRALDDPDAAVFWFANGGLETLHSYGVHVPTRVNSARDMRTLALEAAASIPGEHAAFLRALPVAIMHGRYFFVHAGVRTGIPLAEQSIRDMTEIRQRIGAPAPSHVIVHGHTPVREPESRAHEIVVDTGCYATGRLSAVRLDGEARDFLWVTGR